MFRLHLLLGVLFFSYIACSDTNYRLNTPIIPAAYQITITPYFETGDDKQFTFDGTVSIQLATTANTNQIKLHSEDLNYTAEDISVTVYNSGANVPLNANNPLTFDKNYTFAYINLQNELQEGVEYVLQIKYSGPIRADLNGFYRNYYWENGVKKWLGATQMEPTHARKAFPCFDEPELKAVFTLHVDRPAHYQPSLSNTRIEKTENLTNGYVREMFFLTPRMSTYLVAFLVSEFEAGHMMMNDTRELGIYTRPEAKDQTDYAFDIAKKVVEALGNYFGIDYYDTSNYLRLDHVALIDFRAGAMENWGLIKYRESLLLYVPEHSTPYFKYRVAQIIAHETTHMWFGNLVTCHWWSNTWLNEGFANYFQDYITTMVDPSVGSDNMLVIGSMYSAYDADNGPNSAPISNINVNSPAEISAHFGTISYQKAGSVIRMMHHLIGDEAFRHGLHSYLKNNSLSSGYPDKLYQGLREGVSTYNSLSTYPGADIAEVMSSWITQSGHPLLHVKIDHDTDTVTLTQKRFYVNSSYSSNETYMIPITYTTQMAPNFENTKPMFIMTDKTHEFKIENISKAHSWVIFNVQETGLYRVNYDDHSWSHIASALKGADREHIHYLNRAKIVNDLFALLYADEVSFSTLHDVLSFLSEETEYSVWLAALRGFSKIRNYYLGDDEALATVQSFILEHLSHGISKLGYTVKSSDSFEDLRNRMQLLEMACTLGHSECVEKTTAMFKAFRHNGTEVEPSLRPTVYCTGLRYGNEEDYDFLWNRMVNTNVANEVWIIEDALGCTSSEQMLKRYLVSMTIENTPIRTQDLTTPLSSVLNNYINVHVVMDGLKSNYTLWSSIYPSMETILSTVASALHTENDRKEFEAWLDSCTECSAEAKTSARSTLVQVRASKSWADSHRADILGSLKSGTAVIMPSIIMMLLAFLLFTEY